jgi:hypothetical protein
LLLVQLLERVEVVLEVPEVLCRTTLLHRESVGQDSNSISLVQMPFMQLVAVAVPLQELVP